MPDVIEDIRNEKQELFVLGFDPSAGSSPSSVRIHVSLQALSVTSVSSAS